MAPWPCRRRQTAETAFLCDVTAGPGDAAGNFCPGSSFTAFSGGPHIICVSLGQYGTSPPDLCIAGTPLYPPLVSLDRYLAYEV